MIIIIIIIMITYHAKHTVTRFCHKKWSKVTLTNKNEKFLSYSRDIFVVSTLSISYLK